MRITLIGVSIAAVLAAAPAAFVTGAAQADDAALEPTQLCEPMSAAYGVNDAGTVAGYAGTWPDLRAAVCSRDGVLSYLAVPEDATSSIAIAINRNGLVAGTIYLSSGRQEAVVWGDAGSITRLGFLPGGTFTSAQDINDHGWVVGVAGGNGVYQGFLWDGDGPIEPLPMPSATTNAFAQGINNRGTVVGSATAPFAPNVAVVWNDREVSALPPLAEGATAIARDINDDGQIVGQSAPTAPPWLERHPVLWRAGDIVDLGSLGGAIGLAAAVNADGVVAGYLANDANENRGFAWQDGTRTLLDPLPGDTQSTALGINSSGEIVGVSLSSSGLGRAVRWTQIRDTTPPDVVASVDPSTLWPPNHRYVTVTATVAATDDTDPSPLVELVGVFSNEADNGTDDGATVNDVVTLDDVTFRLRAERDGTGGGRIYTITYRATDGSGNTTTRSLTVAVPIENSE